MFPKTISHYRIIRKLGRGGMGEVYLAEDTKLKRPLALKLLLAEFTRDAKRLRRFEQEARAASALNHPNILTIYEIGETEDAENERHYIATEYIDGPTLRQHIKGRPLSLAEVLDMSVQIASALSSAHQAGIIHRDIKPENIMVRHDGYVKVLDFGLAKLAESPQDAQPTVDGEAETIQMAHTAPGVVMGTTAYMSPEQAKGLPVDARTDIWSFGVVLYEMLTGRAPFDGETNSHVVVAIMEKEPAPLVEYVEDAPAELQRIVSKALAKDRQERYQTVKDLLIDLRQLKQRLDLRAEMGRTFSTDATDFTDATDADREMPAAASSAPRPRVQTTATASPVTADAHLARSTSASTRSLSAGGLANDRRRTAILITGVLLCLVLSLVYYFYYARSSRRIEAVAVLPFVNVGADPNTEWLSDGITESLINSLSPSLGVKVMSRNSVFRYKGKDVDAYRVGQELGVGAVLTGQLTQRGDGLIVSVELVDARDNTHIWGDQYNRKLADALTVQEEIAREIAMRLRSRLERGGDPKHFTDDNDAYQNYLRGRYFWNKRNEDSFRKAIAYFNLAIERDPNYALAYAGLADTYALMSDYSIVPPRDAMPKARAAAERALAIDNTLAEAHTSLAFVRMAYDWKWREAESDFRRAIELNPNYATAHQWYASYLLQMRRFDEALTEIHRAQELDPLSLIINANSGLYLYYAQQYEHAVSQLRRTLEVDPTFGVAHLYLGYVYLQQPGQADAAIEEFHEAVRYMGDDPETLAALGYAYAVAGRPADAQKILEQLQARQQHGYVSPYFIAIVYTGMGDRERAFEWLEKSYRDRHPGMILLNSDPRFDTLRPDPRFKQLLQRIEQPDA